MSDVLPCASCGASIPAGRSFCSNCGVKVADAAPAAAAQPPSGFIQNGVWQRPAEELVRRVPRDDLKRGLLSAGVAIPRGTVGIVVVDGSIAERLRPGFRTTETVASRFANLFTGKLDNSALYLVDLRPILLSFESEAQAAGVATRYEIVVEVALSGDDARLLRAIESFVRDRDAVGSREVYNALRPQIAAVVEPRLTAQRLDATRRAAVEAEVRDELQKLVGDKLGFELSVRVVAGASSTTINLRLGEGATPQTKKCVSCGHVLEASRKFCTKCSAPQPVATQPSRSCGQCGQLVAEGRKFCTGCGTPFVAAAAGAAPIYTSDGQQLEIDLVVRAEGREVADSSDRLRSMVAAAASQHLRGRAYGDVATAEGMRALEQLVRATLRDGARALSLDVTEVTLLDVRAKGKEWLLGARAELERAMAQVEVGREWAAVDAKQLDLKALYLDIELRQRRMERDQAFSSDADDVADRDRRQALLDGEARLDAADANRAADRNLSLDAAQRREARAVRGEDQADALTGALLEQERVAQSTTFDRTNELSQIRHERSRDTEEVDHRRAQETTQTRHEMGMEREVAQHDAGLSREAMALGSERTRRELDDRGVVARGDAETGAAVARTQTEASAFTARTQAETDAFGTRARGTAEVELTKARGDVAFEDEARREQLKLEKLRALMAIDEASRASERESSARMAELNAAHERQLRELENQRVANRSVEEILALTNQGAEVRDVLVARAGEQKTSEQLTRERELYEKMLAQQAAAQAAADAKAMQMVQMMSAQAAQQMQVLGNVTSAAVGGQREAEAARQAAHAQGARGAVAMAERAMGGMAQVATAGAGVPVYVPGVPAPPAPPVAAPPGKAAGGGVACPACAAEVAAGETFCGSCGARVS